MHLGARGALAANLSRPAPRSAALLPIRLVDRRRPRRQSLRHRRRSRATTLKQNALASLRRYRARIAELARLSVDHRAGGCGAAKLSRRARPRAGGAAGEARRHQGAQSRRGLSPVSHLRPAQARRHHRPHESDERRTRAALLCQCRRADPRSPRAGECAERGEARLDRGRSRAAGALRRADLPFLDGAARPPREHDAHHRGPAGDLAGDRGHGDGEPPSPRSAEWKAWLLAELRRPRDRAARARRSLARGAGDARYVPLRAGDARRGSTARRSARSSCR